MLLHTHNMDFEIGWGTDEIAPTRISDYGMYDIYMPEKKIQQHVKFPTHKYPDPVIKPKLAPVHVNKNEQNIEGFVDAYGTGIPINEKTLMIMLLIILVVICTVMYQSIKQTQESIKVLLAIIVAQNSKK